MPILTPKQIYRNIHFTRSGEASPSHISVLHIVKSNNTNHLLVVHRSVKHEHDHQIDGLRYLADLQWINRNLENHFKQFNQNNNESYTKRKRNHPTRRR